MSMVVNELTRKLLNTIERLLVLIIVGRFLLHNKGVMRPGEGGAGQGRAPMMARNQGWKGMQKRILNKYHSTRMEAA